MVTSTMVGMTISFSFPLLSLVLERDGVASHLIGLNAAVYGLAVLVLGPWLPRVIDRLGPVVSILLGQAVCVVCFLILPLSHDLVLWSVLRFFLGGGVALAWIASEAAVNALAPEGARGRVMGLYATLFCVGYACGPLLIAVTGTTGVLPFLAAAGLIAFGVVPLALSGGAGDALAAPASSNLPRLILLAPLALSAILAFGLVETTLFALMPLYGLSLGYDEAEAALLLSVLIAGNIVMQLPIGWLADRWSARGMVIVCAVVGGLGLALWPLALDVYAIALPLLLIGGGILGGLYSLSLTLLGTRFRGGDLAVANTAFVLMYQVGAMIGPAVTGSLMNGLGPHSLPLALALTLMVFAGTAGAGWPRPAAGPA